MRVSDQMQSFAALANIQRQSALLARYQNQAASGIKLRTASDDSTNFSTLLRTKSDLSRLETYAQTMRDAAMDLNAGVDASLEAQRTLVRARQIATDAANGPQEAASLEAFAVEIDSLLERLLSAGNSKVDGKYVFSGTSTDTPPFRVDTTNADGRPASIAYDGSADRARVLVGPGQTRDTKYVGSEVFQQPGADLFQTLISLRDDLRDGTLSQTERSQALNQRLADIQSSQDALAGTIAEQSASLAALEATQARMTDLRLSSIIRATELEGADIAEAAVRIQELTASLEASLAVTSNLLRPSLLDFIR